jgi:hypothetical protein
MQTAADLTQTLTDAGVAINTDHFYTAGYGGWLRMGKFSVGWRP